MRLKVTGRHVEITEALHEHIEKKLDKMSSYFDDIIEARVVLSVEKYRQFAEVAISGRGNMRAQSKEATDDMYVSIDKAIEKTEKQVRRHFQKTRKEKRRRGGEPRSAEEAPEEESSDSEELFEQHGPYRVSISDKFPPKPMSVREAILQLDASDDTFLAFVNEETNEVNVVFTEEEGSYRLLRRSF